MSKENIAEMIKIYKKGNENILTEIWLQMLPLIKKQARRTHFMEYDDAYQEYSISLINAVRKIRDYDTDMQCLSYIVSCINHKFCSLYKSYHKSNTNEILFDTIPDKNSSCTKFDDMIFLSDIQHLLAKYHQILNAKLLPCQLFIKKLILKFHNT